MAKKQETKKETVETPRVAEQPKVKTTVVEKPLPSPKNTCEIKDRNYYLSSHTSPLSYSIKAAGIYYFDEEKGYERELKYCENQQTPFVDEMKGDQRLSHIIFRSGSLYVPKEKTTLQKLLSLYHPHKDQIFYEYKPAEVAEQQIDILEMVLFLFLKRKLYCKNYYRFITHIKISYIMSGNQKLTQLKILRY